MANLEESEESHESHDQHDFAQPDGVGAVPRPDARRPGERRVPAVGAQRAPRPPQPPRRRGTIRAAHGLIDWGVLFCTWPSSTK